MDHFLSQELVFIVRNIFQMSLNFSVVNQTFSLTNKKSNRVMITLVYKVISNCQTFVADFVP